MTFDFALFLILLGALLGAATIYLVIDLTTKKQKSLLYKKVGLVKTLVDTISAIQDKEAKAFFTLFKKAKLEEKDKEAIKMTMPQFIEANQIFSEVLDQYFRAIRNTDSIELIDAQPDDINKMKSSALEIVKQLDEIRLYIQALHAEGISATTQSARSKNNLQRISEDELSLVNMIRVITPKSSEQSQEEDLQERERERSNGYGNKPRRQ